MSIVSEIINIKNNGNPTTEYVEAELKKLFPESEDFLIGKYSSGGELKMPWNVFKSGKLNPERIVVEKA